MEFISNSLEDTFLLASHIAKQCNGGEIILLNGDLGAGKTTFTKGFAKALGITNAVTSPTFTLMKTYHGRLRLYHFDMYRIIDEGEVEELGFEDNLGDEEAVCIIEWNKFSDLHGKIIKINIEYLGESQRKFDIEGIDETFSN